MQNATLCVWTHTEQIECLLAKPCYQLATHVLEQRPKLFEACRVPAWFWVIKHALCASVQSHVHRYEIMSANCNSVQSLSKKEYKKCTKLQNNLSLAWTLTLLQNITTECSQTVALYLSLHGVYATYITAECNPTLWCWSWHHFRLYMPLTLLQNVTTLCSWSWYYFSLYMPLTLLQKVNKLWSCIYHLQQYIVQY
jgi:hypothetical protein